MMMVAITAKHKKGNQTLVVRVGVQTTSMRALTFQHNDEAVRSCRCNGRITADITSTSRAWQGSLGEKTRFAFSLLATIIEIVILPLQFHLMRRSREKVTWADIYGPTSPHSWTDRMMAAFAVVVAFMVMIWAAFELCRWLLQYFL